jgi:alpha-D-xyloside xylohydrolase
VFKRWLAFGLLSSHSRLHGSESYRVPWLFDEAEGRDEADPDSAVSVARRFTRLKMSLMPYLHAAGLEAHRTGVPVMRPMQLAFPEDPAVAHLDRQYLLGPDVLVAPVFSADGEVQFYLPAGRWTGLLTGETVEGGRWLTERHGFESLPLYVREGAVLPLGARDDRAEYDYLDGLTLQVLPGDGERALEVTAPDGGTATFRVDRRGGRIRVTSDDLASFSVRLPGGRIVRTIEGTVEERE